MQAFGLGWLGFWDNLTTSVPTAPSTDTVKLVRGLFSISRPRKGGPVREYTTLVGLVGLWVRDLGVVGQLLFFPGFLFRATRRDQRSSRLVLLLFLSLPKPKIPLSRDIIGINRMLNFVRAALGYMPHSATREAERAKAFIFHLLSNPTNTYQIN